MWSLVVARPVHRGPRIAHAKLPLLMRTTRARCADDRGVLLDPQVIVHSPG